MEQELPRKLEELLTRFSIPFDDSAELIEKCWMPVDTARMRAFYRHELTPVDEMETAHLIAHYREWREASRSVIGELDGTNSEVEGGSSIASPPIRKWPIGRVAGLFALAASLLFIFAWLGRGGAYFRDGNLQLAFRNGEVTGLENYDADWRRSAAEALESGVDRPAIIKGLQDSLPLLRGNEVPLSDAIVSPYLTIVRAQQPELKWAVLQNADSYRVELFELGESIPVFVYESKTPRSKVSKPLERGRTYQWKVYYEVGDQTLVAPKSSEKPAVFRVLDDAALQRVIAEEQVLSDSQLLLGLLYAREGLLDEAASCWQRLKEQNSNSVAIKRLLDSLNLIRGGYQEE